MTVGGNKETLEKRAGGGGGKKEVEPLQSFTTLSTIAIQAGQSQITISVLKSGAAVHLQLLQASPCLSEVGGNQEESHRLIWELQQLLDKLQKHQQEVLAIVDQKRRSKTGSGEKENEEEQGVRRAMKCSLSEGWSLLRNLLDKRLEVLQLAADFYHWLAEFGRTISAAEDLQFQPNNMQVKYAPIRRGNLK